MTSVTGVVNVGDGMPRPQRGNTVAFFHRHIRNEWLERINNPPAYASQPEPLPYRNCSPIFRLRVRAEPDTTADIVGRIDPGEEVRVIATSGDWCQIQRQLLPSSRDNLSRGADGWAIRSATDIDRVRHVLLAPVDDKPVSVTQAASNLILPPFKTMALAVPPRAEDTPSTLRPVLSAGGRGLLAPLN